CGPRATSVLGGCQRPGSCFFFQAEDGIRDGHVTGVQTCALPIYRLGSDRAAAARSDPRRSPNRSSPETRAASHRPTARATPATEIGRASCRERVEIPGDGGPLKKKKQRACANEQASSQTTYCTR